LQAGLDCADAPTAPGTGAGGVLNILEGPCSVRDGTLDVGLGHAHAGADDGGGGVRLPLLLSSVLVLAAKLTVVAVVTMPVTMVVPVEVVMLVVIVVVKVHRYVLLYLRHVMVGVCPDSRS
jgi:hypothetical protein